MQTTVGLQCKACRNQLEPCHVVLNDAVSGCLHGNKKYVCFMSCCSGMALHTCRKGCYVISHNSVHNTNRLQPGEFELACRVIPVVYANLAAIFTTAFSVFAGYGNTS